LLKRFVSLPRLIQKSQAMLSIEYIHKKARYFRIELSVMVLAVIGAVIVLWQLTSWALPLK
jgi:hypothetical protein